MTAPEPAWLAAWRAGRAAKAPQRPAVAAPPPQAVAAAPPPRVGARANPRGFAEPAPWDYDGGRRREPVLDVDHDPPLVVRRVGWSRCLRCRRPFWSSDVVRLRLCDFGEAGGCRGDDERCAGGCAPAQ